VKKLLRNYKATDILTSEKKADFEDLNASPEYTVEQMDK
jgi:hypothetical protein